MKIEFLASGAAECPLVRLFDYGEEEVERLREACRDLADGRITEFALDDQPWVESVAGCRFLWRLAKKDVGVKLPSRVAPFVLDFTDEGWREVEGKLEPFCSGSRGYIWLTNEGDVRVLISWDGKW